MGELIKQCKECLEWKDLATQFYMYKGVYRTECKKCFSSRMALKQKQTKAWKTRFKNKEEQRKYMREYYAKNKEKYVKYQENFLRKNPEYHKMYARDRKNNYRYEKDTE